jgi:hypothetical protein
MNSIKADKRSYIDNLAKEAASAAAKENMKNLYDITRKLSGKYQRHIRTIKDKNWEKIMTSKNNWQDGQSISVNY